MATAREDNVSFVDEPRFAPSPCSQEPIPKTVTIDEKFSDRKINILFPIYF
jgi:hypothetical protein